MSVKTILGTAGSYCCLWCKSESASKESSTTESQHDDVNDEHKGPDYPMRQHDETVPNVTRRRPAAAEIPEMAEELASPTTHDRIFI